eukprot:1160762-Pelagomonas_calceolata.AAC.6
MLLFEGLKLILGPGVFTVFYLHKLDVSLFWKDVARMADLGSRYQEFVLVSLAIRRTSILSGRLEVSLKEQSFVRQGNYEGKYI